MKDLLISQFNTQINRDILQKGKILYNDVLNQKLALSDFTLSELIPFIAYGYYKLGLNSKQKGGE